MGPTIPCSPICLLIASVSLSPNERLSKLPTVKPLTVSLKMGAMKVFCIRVGIALIGCGCLALLIWGHYESWDAYANQSPNNDIWEPEYLGSEVLDQCALGTATLVTAFGTAAGVVFAK